MQLIKHRDSWLDGVYLEQQPELLTAAGRQGTKALREHGLVGVWNYAGSADSADLAKRLVDAGFSYVNTDFPRDFAPLDEEDLPREEP